MASSAPSISIVIPAFNEGLAIRRVLLGLRDVLPPEVKEVIVVNDGSSDNTAEEASAVAQEIPQLRLLHHSANRGYGASLKTGIRAAASDHVLIMDSDGQHRPEDMLALIARLGQCPMVIGARMGLIHSQAWRMPGKWLLLIMAQYLTRTRIPDLNSGLRLVHKATALPYLPICPNGFSISTTLTMAFLSRGHGVQYVPIQVQKRVGKSTVSLRTGLDTIILILRLATLFNPLRIFLPFSFAMLALGTLWGFPLLLMGKGVSVGAMLAIVTGLLLFAIGLISDQISQLRMERFE